MKKFTVPIAVLKIWSLCVSLAAWEAQKYYDKSGLNFNAKHLKKSNLTCDF